MTYAEFALLVANKGLRVAWDALEDYCEDVRIYGCTEYPCPWPHNG